ncbi:hypothetical protein NDU88_008802 [Pleurodeles waltl]|uniref:Uncharacterized protein n=1 Tax=Pleurodeles waltl TaxID=8319 RepID=A0AAV7P0B1_PLEWA|nr:hypothetical protein NDU88_008802 [Pleurodeles waltl]
MGADSTATAAHVQAAVRAAAFSEAHILHAKGLAVPLFPSVPAQCVHCAKKRDFEAQDGPQQTSHRTRWCTDESDRTDMGALVC